VIRRDNNPLRVGSRGQTKKERKKERKKKEKRKKEVSLLHAAESFLRS
jgi:hypothetical protein